MRLIKLVCIVVMLCAPLQAQNLITSFSDKDVYVTFTSCNDAEIDSGVYRTTRMASFFNSPAIYYNVINKCTGVKECLVFYDYKESIVKDLTAYASRYMMSTTHIQLSDLQDMDVVDLDSLLPKWTREEAYHYFWTLNDKKVWVIDKSNLGEDPTNLLVVQTMPGVFYEY